MIKLTKNDKPIELTTDLQKRLTDEFIKTGNTVWNKSFIKNGLLEFSHNKCCYCETNINEESKYLEVEHFHHKDKYKSEVLDWDNLLPSCKKCNGTKGNHDTVTEPIINPTINDPKLHLRFWRYRIKGFDTIGKLTVSVLDLNNQDRLVKKRFEIGNAIQEKLEQFIELIDEYIDGIQTSTLRKNRIVNGTKNLLREGLPTAEYSASSAVVILTDPEFENLKKKLISISLWDEELIELEKELKLNSLKLEK